MYVNVKIATTTDIELASINNIDKHSVIEWLICNLDNPNINIRTIHLYNIYINDKLYINVEKFIKGLTRLCENK